MIANSLPDICLRRVLRGKIAAADNVLKNRKQVRIEST
jgi:hypothetical protein